MDADVKYDVTDAVLITSPDGSGFLIRSQIVDQLPSGPQQSGKYVHLTMTPAQAMRLLAQLHVAQKTFGLLVPTDIRVERVPPAKDRN